MWDIEKVKSGSKEVGKYLKAGWEPFGVEGGYILFRTFKGKEGHRIIEDPY